MRMRRLMWICRLSLISKTRKRAAYAKKAGIYAHMGENVSIQSRFVPIYSELISFHNNIVVARNVDFVTHDAMNGVFNRMPGTPGGHKERIGCIEVMDNVFIGSNSVILYGTRIGPNVVIGAGSVVIKDCEPNGVYVGVPARRVGSFEDYMKKRLQQEHNGEIPTTMHNQALTEQEIRNAWEIFQRDH